MSDDFIIEIAAITKRFAGHVAVSGLSLQVPRGAVYGLLGPNGAGKTTTIRMMMDIILPDEGTVRLFGDERGGRHHSAEIGYLPEERGLYKKMKVRDALVFLAVTKGVKRAVAQRKADEWLDRLDLGAWKLRKVEDLRPGEAKKRGAAWLEKFKLDEWATHKVEDLSKGMQQKVQFIATMLHEPALLILDEPFAGLDPINTQELKDVIVQLSRSGTTVIFSTHQLDVAERICDHVCIIAAGRKVLDGAVADVKREHGGTHVAVAFAEGRDLAAPIINDRSLVAKADDYGVYAELALADGVQPQALLERLVRSAARLQRFEHIEPSLNRIFLDKVGAAAELPQPAEVRRG
jgi:ABC-2 type transport system ATP-binding protein